MTLEELTATTRELAAALLALAAYVERHYRSDADSRWALGLARNVQQRLDEASK